MGISGIYAEIYSCLASDVALLPALPEITITIRKKLLDPECTIISAAALLRSDPGLVAFIMRISNSVRYYLRHPPRDIEAAVFRLGLSKTASLATTYATLSMFTVSEPALKKKVLHSYNNATKVSVLSYLLADKLQGFDADKAMLAGLLQDISIPPLLIRLYDRPEILNDNIKRSDIINKLSPMVSAIILKHWGFDQDLIEVVRTRKQWQRNEQDDLDLSDIILIARWYALMGTAEFSSCPSFSKFPAIHKLPVSEITHDKSIQLLHDTRIEMDVLQSSLQAANNV